MKNWHWILVVIVVALLCWFGRGCYGDFKAFDIPKGETKVTEVRVDTVYLPKVKIEYVSAFDGKRLEDSLLVYRVKIDSLTKNRVLVVNEKNSEVIKVVPVLDSLGGKVVAALDLKDGDKVLKLPTVVNIEDSMGGEWLKMRILIDEKPEFLGARIVSKIDKEETITKDNFWVKEKSVVFVQRNPYLNKIDVRYLDKRKTVKGKVVKYGGAVLVGVVGGIIINNKLKK
jgi:hypothetical protein